MRFDPFSWSEVSTDGENAPKGRLRLQFSAPSALYIEAEGYEVLAGFGTAFTLDLSAQVIWRAEAPKGTRAFVYAPRQTSVVAAGEVFTNIDRMPHESGQMVEVQRSLRMFELERRAALREIRAERAALEHARRQSAAPAPEPEPEPGAGPETEAGAEQEAAE